MTIDLWNKAKAVVTYEFTRSLRKASQLSGVSKSSISRWRHETRIKRVQRVKPANVEIHASLLDFVAARPSCRLEDMRSHVASKFGRTLSITTAHRLKKAAGITRKRLVRTVDPVLASPDALARVRDALDQSGTVAIDETCFYVLDRPRYGYAVKGRRARILTAQPRKVSGVRRCTVLAAMTSDGVVDFDVIEGSCNQQLFAAFVSRLGAPSGTCLLMDNVRFHDTTLVRAAISGRGFQAVFTPTYSPWSNPIEMAFSKMKAAYRSHCESNPSCDVDDFVGRLVGSLFSVTPQDCRSYFEHVKSLVAGPLQDVARRLG